MSPTKHSVLPRSADRTGIVSHGLNLWLELADPNRMPELLTLLLRQRDTINAALNDLHYVHFARFLPTPDSKVLQVITSFDGELRAYVLDFVLVIGDQFDQILDFIKNRPPRRVKDHPTQFLQFIIDHDLGSRSGGIRLYSAYPQTTVIDIIGASGLAPALHRPDDVAVDRSDVQANVLRGIRASVGQHVGLRFSSADGARALLGELLSGDNGAPQISSDETRPQDSSSRPYVLTLGLSYRGLSALGLSEDDQKAFATAHRPFVDGPERHDTAIKVGDSGPSDPAHWQLGGNHPVDMLVSIYANDAQELERQSSNLLARCAAHHLSVVNAPWPTQSLRDEDVPERHFVHFGYVDGLSQPRLAIAGEPARDTDTQPLAAVGEFLLGDKYPNVFGGRDSLGGLSAALAQNATFAAIRIMEQDVAAFEALLTKASAEHGVDRDWLAAKLMGRWRDGTPLEQSPDRPIPEHHAPSRNRFDYLPSFDHPSNADDSAGLRCPIGAHIRRMNPRSSRVAGRPFSRRLLRRGMPYGPKYLGMDDGKARGLVGLFLCADLDRQYEFILRQWAQGDRAAHGLVGQQDPIIGAQTSIDDAGQMTGEFRIPRDGGNPQIVIDLPRLVKTVGSVYLFMPGLGGLRHLAGIDHGSDRVAKKPAVRVPVRATGAFDPETFDPRAREFRDDPFTAYAWFRKHRPLAELPLMKSTWVFSHRLVRKIAADPQRFRKRRTDDIAPVGLLKMDPPAHTGCRSDMELLFTDVLAQIEPGIAGRVAECYAEVCKNTNNGRAQDWLAKFARPLARTVFLDLFGLTPQHAAKPIEQVEHILALATPAADRGVRNEIESRIGRLGATLFASSLAGEPMPGRLFDRILRMTTVHDERSNRSTPPMSALDVERTANAATLAMTGILPLQWFITLATWRLLDNQGERLSQIRNDASISNADVIDELLRFDASAPLSDRFVARPTDEIDGVELVQNQRLTLVLAAANRDEVEFGPNADTIDFKRGKGPGLAFGELGARSCLGRELVYAVMKPVIQRLRDAEPMPRLADDFAPAWGLFDRGAMFRAMVDLMVHC